MAKGVSFASSECFVDHHRVSYSVFDTVRLNEANQGTVPGKDAVEALLQC